MALCPFAVHKLIEPGSNDPAIKPRVAVLHVDAGGVFSLFSFFKFRSGGIESHFHIRRDGVIEQYRDTGFQADANLKANDFAVSIETQGLGLGQWNRKQLASIKRLLRWLKETHGIPLVRCSGPFGAGVGYHTMWGSPSDWTPVAKSCPGPNRIKQFEKVLVPWMKTQVSHPKPKRVSLEIVTANLWRENPKVAKDLAQLAKSKAHIIGIQEGAPHADELRKVKGYHITYGGATGSRVALQNPILVREDLEVLNTGHIRVSNPVGTSPARLAVWVSYRFKGQLRAHVNTHFNSHVQKGQRTPHKLPRVKEYVKGIKRVRRLCHELQRTGHKVTLTGDLNWSFSEKAAQWLWSPKKVFRAIGLEAQYAHRKDLPRPKGDSRRIEYVMADPKDLTLASQRFIKPEHSDHPFHSVTYFVKGL